jgi:hypothetical protein
VWDAATSALADLWGTIEAWIEEAWRQFNEMIEAALNAVKNFFTEFVDWIKEFWEKIKTALRAAWDAITGWFSKQWEKLKEFWQKFMYYLPSFDRFTISDIYIRCFTDPKNCMADPQNIEPPKFTFCFKATEMSFCAGPASVPLNLLYVPIWLIEHIGPPIKEYFEHIFQMKEISFKVPNGINWQSLGAIFSKPLSMFMKDWPAPFSGFAPNDPVAAEDTNHNADAGSFQIPYGFTFDDWSFKIPTKLYDVNVLEDGSIKSEFTPDPDTLEQYEKLVEDKTEQCAEHDQDYADVQSESGDVADNSGAGSSAASDQESEALTRKNDCNAALAEMKGE